MAGLWAGMNGVSEKAGSVLSPQLDVKLKKFLRVESRLGDAHPPFDEARPGWETLDRGEVGREHDAATRAIAVTPWVSPPRRLSATAVGPYSP